jgi:hypothetical protein
MVRRISISVLSILALAVVAAASSAKTMQGKSPAMKQEMAFTGDIVAVDMKAHTFTVKATDNGKAREMMFHVGTDARVVIDGETMLVSNLERGDRVTVEYRSSGSTHTATTVKRHKKTR